MTECHPRGPPARRKCGERVLLPHTCYLQGDGVGKRGCKSGGGGVDRNQYKTGLHVLSPAFALPISSVLSLYSTLLYSTLYSTLFYPLLTSHTCFPRGWTNTLTHEDLRAHTNTTMYPHARKTKHFCTGCVSPCNG